MARGRPIPPRASGLQLLTPLIAIHHLRKIYLANGEPVHALEDVGLAAHTGEFLSIVGPSGCGKSTLLKIVAGLYPPTSGEVLLNGAPVRGPHPDVGLVFQGPALMRWRTVLSNVMLQAEIRRLPMAEYRARAMELLQLVGLAGFEDAYPFQLSGGMQQRTAICRALVHDPPLLVMDEPFGALDALTREQMNFELMNLWSTRRKTVLFVTHSIPEAVFLSDRILVMSARPGRILAEIPVALPRPRTVDTMASPEFGRLTSEIRRLMQARGTLD